MARATAKAPVDSGLSTDRARQAKARMTGTAKTKVAEKKEVPYPSVDEPALVHPWNNAIIKMRDNGNIDVFSNTDNGLRINPTAKTVDMFTGTIKHHVAFIRSFVSRDEIHKVGGNWTIECATANIKSKGDVNVTAGKNINMKAGKDINIDAGGKYNFK